MRISDLSSDVCSSDLNADMANAVMTAAIHAAGHFDLDLADIVEVVERLEAIGDVLRHANRAGIGERAVVETRAADQVGQQADVRCRQAMFGQRLPDRKSTRLNSSHYCASRMPSS